MPMCGTFSSKCRTDSNRHGMGTKKQKQRWHCLCRSIMMGAMDNITKGAAGQAVQNMNIMFGLSEQEGLRLVPMVP